MQESDPIRRITLEATQRPEVAKLSPSSPNYLHEMFKRTRPPGSRVTPRESDDAIIYVDADVDVLGLCR